MNKSPCNLVKNVRRLRKIARVMVVTAATTSILSSAYAIDAVWDNDAGSGDRSWFTPSNWSGNVVPTQAGAYDAIINGFSSLANPVLVSSVTDATFRQLRIGDTLGSAGFLRLETNFLNTSTSAHTIGVSGTGSVVQVSGSTVFARQVTLGSTSTGVGTWQISGGTYAQTAGAGNGVLTIGDAGTGAFEMSGSGSVTAVGNVSLGSQAGSNGTLNLSGSGTFSHSSNSTMTVGGAGSGNLNIAGNTISNPGTNGALVVRSNSAGSGTVGGYGTISAGGDLTMNGMMIADGGGTGDQALNLSAINGTANNGIIFNTIENTTTNGWYAQDQGMLILPTLSSAAGAGTQNWGESAFSIDADIDLVNSAQLTYGASHTAGNLRIDLMSGDRTEFANVPTGALPVVWDLDYSGTTFALTDFRVRYDAVAAGAGESALTFYYSSDGSTWLLLTTVVDTTNNWATTSGVSLGEGYYMLAVPEPSSALLMLGAGLFVAVCGRSRRRRI